MSALVVINLILLIILVVCIVFMIFVIIGHGQMMIRDRRNRDLERRRLEVEETLLVSLLVKTDSIVANLANWYEIQTGQRWNFPNGDAVQKRLAALEQLVKDQELKIDQIIDKGL